MERCPITAAPTVGEDLILPRGISCDNKSGRANPYHIGHGTIQRNTQARSLAGGYEPPLQWLGIRPYPVPFNAPLNHNSRLAASSRSAQLAMHGGYPGCIGGGNGANQKIPAGGFKFQSASLGQGVVEEVGHTAS